MLQFHAAIPLNAEIGYGVATFRSVKSLIRRHTDTPSTRVGADSFRILA